MLTNLFDLDFRERLAVADVAAVAHLALKLDHRHLFVTAVGNDLGLALTARNERRTDLYLFTRVVRDHQTVEAEAGARFEVEFFDLELLAFGDEVLLAAGSNYCKHIGIFWLLRRLF